MTTYLATGGGHGNSFGHWGFAVVGALWIVVGSIQVARPDLSWKMRRWQYRNPSAVQPSARALQVTRGFSATAVVVGIVLIVVAIATR